MFLDSSPQGKIHSFRFPKLTVPSVDSVHHVEIRVHRPRRRRGLVYPGGGIGDYVYQSAGRKSREKASHLKKGFVNYINQQVDDVENRLAVTNFDE